MDDQFIAQAAFDDEDNRHGVRLTAGPVAHTLRPSDATVAEPLSGTSGSGDGEADTHVVPSAAAGRNARSPTRRIVEFCTGFASRIGRLAPDGCEVIRLTVEDDLTTQAGLDKALAAVSVQGIPTLLFAALPCTGGSPYVNLNWRLGPSTRAKIRRHWVVFRILWRNFVTTAERCIANGGHIAIEWPRRCAYWHKPEVQRFMRRYGLQPYHFDGCAYGLVSSVGKAAGKPIRKPWTLAATSESFGQLCRACPHERGEHAKCEGGDARLTEGHTDPLMCAIHGT